MTFLLPLLAKWGVPEKLRAPLQWVIIAAFAVAAFFAVKAIYDRSVVDDYVKDRTIDAIDARDDAATERANDTIANTQNEKDLNDAIDAAPKGGTLSPAAHALACERLRKLGRVPPACGPDSGHRSETGSD